MNSSNTRPSKPPNDSPRTVTLKLRSIFSRPGLRHQRVELGFERHAEQYRGPPEQSADKMKSGDRRQAGEIFSTERNVSARSIEPWLVSLDSRRATTGVQ